MLETIKNTLTADVASNGLYVIRLIVAALCGAAIGIERSRRQKDAGIRTHILVCMGSALMMIVSKYGFFDVVITDSIQADASRIASQVVSGISFLGAGMIFVKNASIKGLTTAAGIWVTAGLGLAIGAGQYTIGVSATLLIVIIQICLHRFFSRVENTVNEFTVIIGDEEDAINKFKENLHSKNISTESYKMNRNKQEGTITLDVVIKKQKSVHMRDILSEIAEIPEVISIEM